MVLLGGKNEFGKLDGIFQSVGTDAQNEDLLRRLCRKMKSDPEAAEIYVREWSHDVLQRQGSPVEDEYLAAEDHDRSISVDAIEARDGGAPVATSVPIVENHATPVLPSLTVPQGLSNEVLVTPKSTMTITTTGSGSDDINMDSALNGLAPIIDKPLSMETSQANPRPENIQDSLATHVAQPASKNKKGRKAQGKRQVSKTTAHLSTSGRVETTDPGNKPALVGSRAQAGEKRRAERDIPDPNNIVTEPRARKKSRRANQESY